MKILIPLTLFSFRRSGNPFTPGFLNNSLSLCFRLDMAQRPIKFIIP